MRSAYSVVMASETSSNCYPSAIYVLDIMAITPLFPNLIGIPYRLRNLIIVEVLWISNGMAVSTVDFNFTTKRILN